MKRLVTVLVVMFFCMTTKAQTIHFVDNYNLDSCGGYVFYYKATGMTSSQSPNVRLEHSFGDGFKDTLVGFFGQPDLDFLFGHSYALPGIYTTKSVLLYNNQRMDSIVRADTAGTCILFHGSIYADFNGNCIFNAGADSLILSPVNIKVDSANIPIDTVQASGYWSYIKRGYNLTAATYKFIILNPPASMSSTCQTANSITVNYPSGVYTDKNFGYTCSGTAFDLSGTYSALLRTSTAGPSWINAYYANAGCTAQSGTVSFKVSPKYSINAASVYPPPASITGNTITWSFTGLHVGVTRALSISVTPTTTYSPTDTACNVMTINPLSGDANPANNVIRRCDSLRASFDPNDKSVLPAGNISAGTMLTYHINFENLGNDTAFNIHVLDTLSPHVLPSTLQLLSASHAVRVTDLAGPAGTRIAKFEFPHIRLAEKTRPLHNKGYVRFSIQTKSGLANNTTIANRAGIYFDFNPVVMTNTATSKIGSPQNVSVLESTPSNSIHPNPATGALTISNTDGTLRTAVLMNATGQVVRRWKLETGENTVSIQGLPAGLYFVHLAARDGGVQAEKLNIR